jgi:UDP-N-acetylglucosamine 2-epimerase (non-hydrolysing)
MLINQQSLTGAQRRKKVLVVLGTRPEAVKLAPLILAMLTSPELECLVVSTGQHRQMVFNILKLFGIKISVDLDVMQPRQRLADLTAMIMQRFGALLSDMRPDLVVVQGDTTTVMAATMCAFYEDIPVAHVEAGLRTGLIRSPFPEEFNRRVVSLLADMHFAPTEVAGQLLLAEGVAPQNVFVCGNTGIDSLLLTLEWFRAGKLRPSPRLGQVLAAHSGHKVIAVTGHRRESFGEAFRNICNAIRRIVEEFPDVLVVYPVHLNPSVQEPVFELLSGVNRLILLEPLDYADFVYLLGQSYLILTDSGGVQEEGPSIGKPVLVMRETTERPEAVSAGASMIVGTSVDGIFDATAHLLRDENLYRSMAVPRPVYGDGQTSKIIAHKIAERLR